MRTPIAAILSLPTQMPRFPSARSAVMPYSRDGADQHFFELRHVLAHVALAFAEVDDRVADELAGTVIGDVAAARGLEKTDALRARASSRSARRLRDVAAAPEGDDGRMFEEEKLIGNRLVLPHLHELLLQPHAVLVGDEMRFRNSQMRIAGSNTRGVRGAFPGSAGVSPAVQRRSRRMRARRPRLPGYGFQSASCFCSSFASWTMSGSVAVGRKALSALMASRKRPEFTWATISFVGFDLAVSGLRRESVRRPVFRSRGGHRCRRRWRRARARRRPLRRGVSRARVRSRA